jgi:hypothetical protein
VLILSNNITTVFFSLNICIYDAVRQLACRIFNLSYCDFIAKRQHFQSVAKVVNKRPAEKTSPVRISCYWVVYESFDMLRLWLCLRYNRHRVAFVRALTLVLEPFIYCIGAGWMWEIPVAFR